MICVLSCNNCGEEKSWVFCEVWDIKFGVGEFFVCMFFFILVFGGIFFIFIDIEGEGSWRLWLVFDMLIDVGFVLSNDINCV